MYSKNISHSNIAIQVDSLSKYYHASNKKKWILQDISFTIIKGERVAIIGLNGSGKSTLLQILAGITKPSLGRAIIYGSCSSMLDVGASLYPELSCRENIALFFNLHRNISQHESIYEFTNEVLHHSQLTESADLAVKKFSTGMYVRLLYWLQMQCTFKVLLFDEVLAAGDIRFRESSSNKTINENQTTLTVTHDINELEKICNRVLWIEAGKLIMDGNINEVRLAYIKKYSNRSIPVALPLEVKNASLTVQKLKINQAAQSATIERKNSINIEIHIENPLKMELDMTLIFDTDTTTNVMAFGSRYGIVQRTQVSKLTIVRLTIPENMLNDIHYVFHLSIIDALNNIELAFIRRAGEIRIIDTEQKKEEKCPQQLKISAKWTYS